jgi:cytochrome P450
MFSRVLGGIVGNILAGIALTTITVSLSKTWNKEKENNNNNDNSNNNINLDDNMNKFKTTILDTFNNNCDIIIEKLKNHTKISTDFQDLMFRFTLDSIGMIAFNFDIGALKQIKVQFAEDFDYCQESTNKSFIDPFWFFKRYFGSGLHYFSALNRINKFAYKIIDERRESIKLNNCEDPKDLLSIYLKNNPNITNKELRDVIINFIIAGRDTTAQALSWCMFELCCNKNIQEKAR